MGITIYSDDPRGIKAAIAEERAKNPKAQITLSRHKGNQTNAIGPDFESMSKAELQAELRAMGIPFETDANKAALVKLARGG